MTRRAMRWTDARGANDAMRRARDGERRGRERRRAVRPRGVRDRARDDDDGDVC